MKVKFSTLACLIVIVVLLSIVLQYGVRTGKANNDSPVVGDLQYSIGQIGPDWYDTDWHYRRPIVITNNSGVELTDYQVLIRLDNAFDQAKPDLSDVVFTMGDGITEISFWIEPRYGPDQPFYIWVKVPSMAIGDNTIYLYYSNPYASSKSNGKATFILFDDDWRQFTTGCVEPDCIWYIRNGTPTVTSGKLELNDSTGISSLNNNFKYLAIGYRANFYSDTFGIHGYQWGGFINGADGLRVIIRDLSSAANYLFLQNRIDENKNYQLGENNWHNDYHVYEIQWQQGKSIGDVDHGAINVASSDSSEVPNEPLPVTFYSLLDSTDTLWVDWVYVREYNNQEPTFSIGIEQGLVDLNVDMVDSPDPLYAGEALTYQLTITNASGINATGVVLTDTLPSQVNLISVLPSQGTCDSQVICNLGLIAGGSDASITLVVATTSDGNLLNTTSVGSLSYDSNITDNTKQISTTVWAAADLSITNEGNPEALKPGDNLVYTLSITNNGPSQAQMVNVVDNLPNEVIYKNSSPVNCTVIDNEVTCPLGNMISGEQKQINIFMQVKTNIYTNVNLVSNATVNSLTYDPNLTNNSSQDQTLVDIELPTVNWEEPVLNEQTYHTMGEEFTMKVNAVDNDEIVRVEFKLWDHFLQPPNYIAVGTISSAPYEANFDIKLRHCSIYQMWAYAYDRAGNYGRSRILLQQCLIFLPLAIK